MNRRDTLKLSILAAASAALTGCGHSEIDKRRAHALAMFLLLLLENYRNEVLNHEQSGVRPDSLLRKVRPETYANMRAFLLADRDATRDEAGNPDPMAFHRKYRNVRLLMALASNFVSGQHPTQLGLSLCVDWPPLQASGRGDDPYSNPDECPCEDLKSCPPVESLLQF
jgi:hypothetical protein